MSATDRLFTPRLAFLAIVAIAASQYLVFVLALLGLSPEYTFGGDFVAFWAAAKETLEGGMTGLYAPHGLEQAIQTHSPHQDLEGLTWQYPPHAGLILSPMGLLPFPIAYAIWCGFGLMAYAAALHAVGIKQRFLLVALASVPVLLALKTGQNALFMGALLIVAVFNARSKPWLAGLAAALLTIKPQLGFLLPVLFLAGGHWRAFLYASLGSLGLFALSVGVLGLGTWSAFMDSVLAVSGSVASGEMPIFKMVNVYAAVQLIGVLDVVASLVAGLTILLAIVAVAWVTRATEDPVWRYSALACLTLFAAPYSYYYELALIVPALIFLVKRGHEAGWLRFEREMLTVVVLLSLAVPGLAIRSGVSISFILMTLITISVARRLRVELAPKSSARLQLA